jgi:hypothetical protein
MFNNKKMLNQWVKLLRDYVKKKLFRVLFFKLMVFELERKFSVSDKSKTRLTEPNFPYLRYFIIYIYVNISIIEHLHLLINLQHAVCWSQKGWKQKQKTLEMRELRDFKSNNYDLFIMSKIKIMINFFITIWGSNKKIN